MCFKRVPINPIKQTLVRLFSMHCHHNWKILIDLLLIISRAHLANVLAWVQECTSEPKASRWRLLVERLTLLHRVTGDISAELRCNYPVCHQASSEMLLSWLYLLIKLTCVRALMWTNTLCQSAVWRSSCKFTLCLETPVTRTFRDFMRFVHKG